MKKTFVKIALGLGSMCALTAPMFAEAYTVKVNVPFAFTAGSTELPAGEYSISPLSGFGSVLLIQGAAGKAIVMSQVADSMGPLSASVSFSEGEKKTLSMVSISGRRFQLALMSSDPGPVKPIVSLRSSDGK